MVYHSIHEEDGDDRLLRSEMLIFVNALKGRMRRPDCQKYNIVPVIYLLCICKSTCSLYLQMLQVSFHGHKARILTAYFDGKRYVVKYSKLYDFLHRTPWTEIFLRWAIPECVGETT